MAQAKAASFGKRGAVTRNATPTLVQRPTRETALTMTESGLPLEEIAKKLLATSPSDKADAKADIVNARTGVVPWSWRAATLAGVSAACLQAGAVVLAAQSPNSLLPGIPVEIGGAGTAAAPVLIAYGLWSGGQDAASALLFSHFGLRSLNMTSPIAYAICGAVMGVASAYLMQVLNVGEAASVTDAIMGLIAGFMYRTLAGIKTA